MSTGAERFLHLIRIVSEGEYCYSNIYGEFSGIYDTYRDKEYISDEDIIGGGKRKIHTFQSGRILPPGIRAEVSERAERVRTAGCRD